jgi:hypothetical protein
MHIDVVKGTWTQETSKHLKERRVKRNRGIYEGERRGVQRNRYDGYCRRQ